MRTSMLESAKEHYRRARNEPHMILCEEQKKLLMKQKELEDKFRREFLDLSLQDTIFRLLIMKETRIADDLRLMFRFSERKWVYLNFLLVFNRLNHNRFSCFQIKQHCSPNDID